MKNCLLTLLSVLFFGLVNAQTYQPTAANLKSRTDFQDRKFGMFIHWGASSVLGDGEWVMENKGINKDDYNKLLKVFNSLISALIFSTSSLSSTSANLNSSFIFKFK